MKAIVLSAGQGRRLLPLTAAIPKCLLPIEGKSLIEWQMDELGKCGIDQVHVVVGFGAERIEALLADRYDAEWVKTVYNPFFAVADNIVSCWMARTEMTPDFVLLNGDTVFEAAILQRLLDAPHRPVTIVTDRKHAYDDDDMKVSVHGEKLVRVGKNIPTAETDGESIGMLLFRGDGAAQFREMLETVVQNPEAKQWWYLSIVDGMACSGLVSTLSITGLQWAEVDCVRDLDYAASLVQSLERVPSR